MHEEVQENKCCMICLVHRSSFMKPMPCLSLTEAPSFTFYIFYFVASKEVSLYEEKIKAVLSGRKKKKEETKQQDKDKSTALLSWIASLQVAYP